MIDVKRMFPDLTCSTDVWISDAAAGDIRRGLDRKNVGRFVDKLRYYAECGFEIGEAASPPAILHEWDKVYRIGQRWTLFRLFGFYEPNSAKSSFIIVRGVMKRDKKLSKRDRLLINEVVDVLKHDAWRKVS